MEMGTCGTLHTYSQLHTFSCILTVQSGACILTSKSRCISMGFTCKEVCIGLDIVVQNCIWFEARGIFFSLQSCCVQSRWHCKSHFVFHWSNGIEAIIQLGIMYFLQQFQHGAQFELIKHK